MSKQTMFNQLCEDLYKAFLENRMDGHNAIKKLWPKEMMLEKLTDYEVATLDAFANGHLRASYIIDNGLAHQSRAWIANCLGD